MHPSPPPVTWPPWSPENGYRSLAPYVSTDSLVRLDLQEPPVHRRDLPPGERLDLLRRLYERLRAKRYRYNLAPWHAGRGQRIRDPRTLNRHSGTCLDVALMFAAMCKAADLRPYVVVLEQADARSGHALVLVNLLDDAQANGGAAVQPLVDCRMTDEKHVYHRGMTSGGWLGDGTAVALDVTLALRTAGGEGLKDFDEALAQGEKSLLGRKYAKAKLVDVVALHADGYPELPPPDDAARPVMSPWLPPRPAFVDYASRRSTHEKLLNARGTVVVHGESGIGKSMLAGSIAAQAPEGCGWFLDASDKVALTASLAQAELAEHGRDVVYPQLLEPADLEGFAAAARKRLREAPSGWVVVLDNANGEPDSLGALPVPDPSRGQVLIITTTNEAWRKLVDQPVEVEALSDADVRDSSGAEIDDAVLEAIGGRPLMMRATERFWKSTGSWWWSAATPGAADTAPRRFLDAVRRVLGEWDRGPGASVVMQAIAWLPPVPLPLEVLEETYPDIATAAIVRRLDDLGLVDVDRTTGTVSMHRLFRQAVRDSSEQLDTMLPLLTSERVRLLLARVPDRNSLNAMAGVMGAISESASVQALHALARLIERHDPERAAEWYRQALDRLPPPTDMTGEERRIASDSLRGEARAVLWRQSTDPVERSRELDAMIAQTQRAIDLCADGGSWDDRLAVSRAQAMLGLLHRKRGSAEHGPRRGLRHLRTAEALLRSSAQSRKELYAEKGLDPEDAPDVDRSEYNLAGLEIDLAQKDAANAAAHLDAAEELYTRIGALRARRYLTDQLSEVVCCRHGQALTAYYRAVLLPGKLPDKVALLREAAHFAHEATSTRQRLAGEVDNLDTRKSATLTLKVALARLALVDHSRSGTFTSPVEITQFSSVEGKALVAGLTSSAHPTNRREGDMQPRFSPVPLIGADEDARSDIESWLGAPPVTALVASFGGDPATFTDASTPLSERLRLMDVFTDRWDTRVDPVTGLPRERNEASELPMAPRQAALVLEVADALGMGEVRAPQHRHYDYVLMLGGLIRACMNRPAHAAKLIGDGTITADCVVALGGHRPFKGDEFPLAAAIGRPELDEEYEALDAGTRAAFGLGDPLAVEGEDSPLVGGTWGVRRYRTEQGLPVAVAAAPSSDPANRRANTPDTYQWFAKEFAHLRPGQRILTITTPIYLPAQHAAAVRMLALPHGVEVETIGNDPDLVPDALAQPFTPTKYLLEVRTTVRSLRALLEVLEQE